MIRFPPTKTHSFRYAKKHIRSRLLRSSFGLVVLGGIVIGLPALWWLDVIFGAVGALFGIYFYQSVQQARHAVVADKQGISFGKKSLNWQDIETVKLRHYGGSKQTISLGASFFELTLRGKLGRISFDSQIDDFKDLLGLIVGASNTYDIKIDESTVHNIAYFMKQE